MIKIRKYLRISKALSSEVLFQENFKTNCHLAGDLCMAVTLLTLLPSNFSYSLPFIHFLMFCKPEPECGRWPYGVAGLTGFSYEKMYVRFAGSKKYITR